MDYIFIDPPFGANIMYSEMNFSWEAWLKVFTNNKAEAIENKVQGKSLDDYRRLMAACFSEAYRVLKPGRWMTVVFHNSRSSVWNAIQEALQQAGFVVADVRTLDKQQGSYRQVTSSTVKQDLIISAYKPNGGLEERFKLEQGTEAGAWDFMETHLRQLPVFVAKGEQAEPIVERMNYLLFDRMVAFHVQRGVLVPLSAANFYVGLEQRYPKRDQMYFLGEQVIEYDRKRQSVKEIIQLQLLITGEASAIEWLRQQLHKKPQTFAELHPQFTRELGGWQKYETSLELSTLLEENFLRYEGRGLLPSQLISWLKLSANHRELLKQVPPEAFTSDGDWLNPDPTLAHAARERWYVANPAKLSDLEKKREQALLKEFEVYRQNQTRRLKVFRLEAVRAGFRKAYQERNYKLILEVAHKLPQNVLQEDQTLIMWYDNALLREEG